MEDDTKPDEENKPEGADTIRFVYQKTRHHRTFHPDGAWAAITPQAEIQFSLFKDVRPIPDEVTHVLTPDGNLGDEVNREVSKRLIREVDATVVMNVEAAKNLVALLNRMIKQLEEHIAKELEKQKAKESKVETEIVS